MGRSKGFTKKSLKKEIVSRGQLFNADPYQATTNNLINDQLILLGSELWAEDPGYLLKPERALLKWQKENPDYSGERNSLSFWQNVKSTFILEVENGKNLSGPFFRGQNGMLDHPFDRPRSWSRDIKTALGFAQTHPVISGPNGDYDCPSLDEILSGDTELSLDEGEEVFVIVYQVASGVGFDLNKENKERYRESIIDKIKNGESIFLKYINKKGRWESEILNIEGIRTHALTRAVKEVGHDKTLKALGLGNVSSNQMRKWVTGLSSEGFDNFLNRLGSNSIKDEFILKERQAIEFVNSQDFVAETKYYSNEEEVVISPHGIGDIQRFDVPVLNSKDSIPDISDQEIEKRFKEGLKNCLGSNPKAVGVGQRNLF